MDAKFSGKTALHYAAAAGKMNIVEVLLEMGANKECEVSSSLPNALVMPIIIQTLCYDSV